MVVDEKRKETDPEVTTGENAMYCKKETLKLYCSLEEKCVANLRKM